MRRAYDVAPVIGLDLTEFAVLLALADEAEADGSMGPRARTGAPYLGRKVCTTTRTIQRTIPKLIDRGLVALLNPGHGGNNRYRIVIPDDDTLSQSDYDTVSQSENLGYDTVSQSENPDYDTVSQSENPDYDTVSQSENLGYDTVSQSGTTQCRTSYDTVSHQVRHSVVRNTPTNPTNPTSQTVAPTQAVMPLADQHRPKPVRATDDPIKRHAHGDPIKRHAHGLATFAFEQPVKPNTKFPAVMALIESELRAGSAVDDVRSAIEESDLTWTSGSLRFAVNAVRRRRKPRRDPLVRNDVPLDVALANAFSTEQKAAR
jgi:hypothetical protein